MLPATYESSDHRPADSLQQCRSQHDTPDLGGGPQHQAQQPASVRIPSWMQAGPRVAPRKTSSVAQQDAPAPPVPVRPCRVHGLCTSVGRRIQACPCAGPWAVQQPSCRTLQLHAAASLCGQAPPSMPLSPPCRARHMRCLCSTLLSEGGLQRDTAHAPGWTQRQTRGQDAGRSGPAEHQCQLGCVQVSSARPKREPGVPAAQRQAPAAGSSTGFARRRAAMAQALFAECVPWQQGLDERALQSRLRWWWGCHHSCGDQAPSCMAALQFASPSGLGRAARALPCRPALAC